MKQLTALLDGYHILEHAHRTRIASATRETWERASLLGLPVEIGLRILRYLRVHDGPLAALPPLRANGPGANEHGWQDFVSPEEEVDETSYGDLTWQLQVNLHRSILLANRQLYEEGTPILYHENALSIRFRGFSNITVGCDIYFSIFDHYLHPDHLNIRRLDERPCSDPLFKFTNLHFDIEPDLEADRTFVRSVLRYVVTWLDNVATSPAPRPVSIDYDGSIKHFQEVRDPTRPHVSCEPFECRECHSKNFEECKCAWAAKARLNADADSVRVLAPLKYLHTVLSVDLKGLAPMQSQVLALAITMADDQKPTNLHPRFALLLRYLNTLPDDADTDTAAEVHDEQHKHKCPKYPVDWDNQDQLLADLTDDEEDDVSEFPLLMLSLQAFHQRSPAPNALSPLGLADHCPRWIRPDVKPLKQAMFRDDVESFDLLHSQILERVDAVMGTYHDGLTSESEECRWQSGGYYYPAQEALAGDRIRIEITLLQGCPAWV